MAEKSAARLRAVVAALRKRTVANGCTPAEAAAAAAKAVQLEAILAAGEGHRTTARKPTVRPGAPAHPWASSHERRPPARGPMEGYTASIAALPLPWR
jgi:hypothetical protein